MFLRTLTRRSPIKSLIPLDMLLMGLLVIGLLAASPARASCEQVGQSEPALDERIDAWFGDWVVYPISSVLFFDLMFWDNTLPLGELPEEPEPDLETPAQREEVLQAEIQRRGAELVGYEDGRGYVYKCRVPARLRNVVPMLDEGATLKRGLLDLQLQERDGQLIGSWEAQDIDVAALGLAPATADDPDAPRIGTVRDTNDGGDRELKQVEIDAIAPFPVVIDLTEGRLLAGETELSWSVLPVQAGSRVQWRGETYEVAATNGRRLSLRGLDDYAEAGAIADPHDISFPLVVVWLLLGAAFFTLRFGFINVRAFGHAFAVVSGKYDNEDDPGEVSHFQALSSALSATVGLGNIAGVAVAVAAGGPGAVVWMVVAAFLGMSSKFAEVTLGQMYREVRADGTVSGGPMHYLSTGLKEMRMGKLGLVLAVLFSVMCIGGSLGGGNMFQSNQSFQALADVVPPLMPKSTGEIVLERLPGEDAEIQIPARTAVAVPGGATFLVTEDLVLAAGEPSTGPISVTALRGGSGGNVATDKITEIGGVADRMGRILPTELDDQLTVRNPGPTDGGATYGLIYGIILTIAVGLVIIGGIKRIGATAGYIVPAMAVVYVLAGVYILAYQGVTDSAALSDGLTTLLSSAFTLEAGIGGFIGVLMTGFQRASFSNEAGVGSASIAHSAASTPEPVSEGIVALLEPFIDTIIVCSVTGLIVVTTDAYRIVGVDGISMTSAAFESGGLPGARYVLAGAVVLFAFSTMISWSYYGERAATWMFGPKASVPYKVIFLSCALIGPIITLGNVMSFSDLMVLGMAFPNVLGLYLLSNKVGGALKKYRAKLKAGTL